ncbi:hypothetical protein AWZ03_007626 [Drosophila navojoa]|uniref:Uncharacterized protein n=1 Tax=Drosophila navojoa TaxID=7232 RepID=A0A484BAM3_DRONA|nr:hypothetical protein AWZ03_007626 [Drosophila navojoa]
MPIHRTAQRGTAHISNNCRCDSTKTVAKVEDGLDRRRPWPAWVVERGNVESKRNGAAAGCVLWSHKFAESCDRIVNNNGNNANCLDLRWTTKRPDMVRHLTSHTAIQADGWTGGRAASQAGISATGVEGFTM